MPGRRFTHTGSRTTDASSALAEGKPQDRFARPPSISYSRYGEPCVGLPERPAKRIVRYEIEAKVAAQPERVSRRKIPDAPTAPPKMPVLKSKRGLNPTYVSSPGLLYSSPGLQKKAKVASQRYAAREEFETRMIARREFQEHSSNFLSTRAACLEMDRISWRSRPSSRRH